ncbi:MAG: septum formation initiator family protein [Anaerolineae bacterium]
MTEQVEEQRDVRKAKGQLSGLQVMFATMLAISLILAINFTSRIAANQPLQEALDRVQAEISQLRLEQSDLIDERDYVQSDAYVEAWARSDGRMVRPGEVLIVPMPVGGSVTAPTPSENDTAPFTPIETTPPQPEPWQLWWALFFDVPPPDF